jgi:amino acid transporter
MIAAIGALMVLVSLFLDWFEPELSAWTVFEIVDLLLAVISLAVLWSVYRRLAARAPRATREVWIPAAALAAFVLVVVALVNHPPAAVGLDEEVGIWIALAGSLLMALGALADRAEVSLSVNVRRPADEHAASTASEPTPVPAGEDPATQPLGERRS